MSAWVIRAGADGETEEANLVGGRAAVGFHDVGDLSDCSDRVAVRARVEQAYPDEQRVARLTNITNQLWAMRGRVRTGDLVVMPLKRQRGQLAIGRCTAGYVYDCSPDAQGRRHAVTVRWADGTFPKSSLKDDLVYTINGALTVFRATRNDAERRLEAVFAGHRDPGGALVSSVRSSEAQRPSRPIDEYTEESETSDPLTVPTLEVLRDRVRTHLVENFAGHKLTDLAAGILTALGFECDVSPEGPDGGVDILCGRGPLGLDAPTVVVEVKSQPTPVDVHVVRGLHSAVNRLSADQGLLIALGGVNKPAKKELDTQRTSMRVWDADVLLDKLFETYPLLRQDLRQRVPLVQSWVLDEVQTA